MANENKNKKPLVTLDAANPAPDGVVKTEPVVGGWAGGADTKPQGNGQEPLSDGSQTINEHQLRNVQSAPSGVSVKDINKAPGSGEVKLGSTPMGVWEGTPEALGYDKIIERMNLTRPVETDEERRARLKKQRRNALFAAIGDGISALSNLYFTTQGSPSADQSKTMSKALTDRYDKEDKERETEEKSRLSTLLSVLNQKRLARSSWLARKNQAELIELRKKAAEAGNKAAMRRVDELMRHNTELERQAREAAEQENKRKNEEMENRNKNRDEQTSIAKSKAAAFASDVANRNANRNSRTANSNKNADRRTAIQATKAAKSGRDGNQPFSHTRTITGYENGKKVVDTYKDHGTSTGKSSGGGNKIKTISWKKKR